MSRGSVWSWQEPPGAWIEVRPGGTKADVERMYVAARQHQMTGAAFVWLPPGGRPGGYRPEDLDAPVVGRNEPEPVPEPDAGELVVNVGRMHFWTHPATGARVLYPGDMVGDVIVHLPVGLLEVDRPLVHRTEHDEIRLPGALLAAFAQHLAEREA